MIAIIDYNAGNTRSVQNTLNRLGCESLVTDDLDFIASSDKVVFPGVGEAGTAMQYIREKGLDVLIPRLQQPVLGICLGLQLMCLSSEESNISCLGIFETRVKKFPSEGIVPHMGWNTIEQLHGPLFSGLRTGLDVYFVHSYYAEICANTTAQTNYLTPFSAALQRDNFYATQFHPEKSAGPGEQILKNFIEL
jgi:glutamine amidotransferase